MARSAINYLRMLQSLLPKGWAWNREEDSGLTEFLYGLSDELTRVDNRSDVLIKERDTRHTYELLVDHENDLGLPDECAPEDQIITERREAVHAKLISRGQQNPTYFINMAAAFGWTITITEYTPFWSGVGVSGDPCGDQWVIFCWKVTIAYNGGNVAYAISGDAVSGDLISLFRNSDTMICNLEKYKPAHTTLLFSYDGPEFAPAFSTAFDAFPSSDSSYLIGSFAPAFSDAFDVRHGGDFGYIDFDISFRKPI